ncbi:RrF2 family transcriptional regulator [Methylophaga thiooxydans]|uniref:Transcriptional regulator superfamily n=1 Tax=Methylophaga thiooxydans DMS010 TaxID=637616 RepID=C0N9G2_9GAMM|nr:Rrf2 family transcriptional regulator [Methylophaga thiooxydans]EEF78562.1 Transcriptional regulator superfamily [Methylophaga thiooxydans DMS010]|mmetsp:Transcript_19453/g.25180  ORF Transcript_19453/g.25180 Transcript_19453/m.25180 type:complete len:144 (-) Transcript_19453:320-751(-)
MQLTTHSDYALRLLIYLAIHPGDKPATVKDAAERYGVSTNHLAKVAQRLVQEKLVISQRGRGGGLKLATTPESINIGQLIRKTENLELLECFGDDCACPIESVCILFSALRKAQKAFFDVLDGYTLADVVKNKHRLMQSLNVA